MVCAGYIHDKYDFLKKDVEMSKIKDHPSLKYKDENDDPAFKFGRLDQKVKFLENDLNDLKNKLIERGLKKKK